MEEFRKIVEECRKGKKNRIIHNASKSHAYILFKNLIEVAQESNEEVRIVSGCLDLSFYKDLIEVTRSCLDSGVKFTVLVTGCDLDIQSNEFAQLINGHVKGKLITNSRELNDNVPHFIIVGDNKYRLELDDELSTAIANFNDPVVADSLIEVFAGLSKICEECTRQ